MKCKKRDNFIEEWYEDIRAIVIAQSLGIDVGIVYSRASRLGLTRQRDKQEYHDARDRWLMQELVQVMSKKRVAFKFNITIEELEDYLAMPVMVMEA